MIQAKTYKGVLMRAFKMAFFATVVGFFASIAQAQTITLPEKITVDEGDFMTTVIIEYDGDDIKWRASKGMRARRVYDDAKNKIVLDLISIKSGTFTLSVIVTKGAKLSEWVDREVTFGGIAPAPKPPEPIPTPPKPIDPPTPTGELRVLFVYESQDALSRTQILALNSTAVRKWLGEKCVKESGQAGYRYWDKDTDTTKELQAWKDLWTATKSTLKTTKPQVVVFRGMSGKAFDLPENEDDLLKLLKKEGE